MLALDKNTWDNLSDKERVNALIDELKSIKRYSSLYYREDKSSRPTTSAVAACSYITEEIEGLLKIIK